MVYDVNIETGVWNLQQAADFRHRKPDGQGTIDEDVLRADASISARVVKNKARSLLRRRFCSCLKSPVPNAAGPSSSMACWLK